MLDFLIAVLHVLAAFGAIASWTAGMCFWWLLNYSSNHGLKPQRRRMFLSFAATLVLGLIAWSCRELQSTGH